MKFLTKIFQTFWHSCKLCGLPGSTLHSSTLQGSELHGNKLHTSLLAGNKLICATCFEELELLPDSKCNLCKIPIIDSSKLCLNCQNNHIYYDNLFCSFKYATPLNKILHDFKYKGNITHSLLLGFLLYQNLVASTHITDYDLIIPIPLHKDKLKQRGFNQSDKILNYTRSMIKNLPITNKILIRYKNTISQAQTRLAERNNNLIDAFKLIPNSRSVAGLKILLVDDVVTTGATINSIAQLLKSSGAVTVDACCLMRTV